MNDSRRNALKVFAAHNGVLTEAQLKRVVALLLDAASPVDQ